MHCVGLMAIKLGRRCCRLGPRVAKCDCLFNPAMMRLGPRVAKCDCLFNPAMMVLCW